MQSSNDALNNELENVKSDLAAKTRELDAATQIASRLPIYQDVLTWVLPSTERQDLLAMEVDWAAIRRGLPFVDPILG